MVRSRATSQMGVLPQTTTDDELVAEIKGEYGLFCAEVGKPLDRGTGIGERMERLRVMRQTDDTAIVKWAVSIGISQTRAYRFIRYYQYREQIAADRQGKACYGCEEADALVKKLNPNKRAKRGLKPLEPQPEMPEGFAGGKMLQDRDGNLIYESEDGWRVPLQTKTPPPPGHPTWEKVEEAERRYQYGRLADIFGVEEDAVKVETVHGKVTRTLKPGEVLVLIGGAA